MKLTKVINKNHRHRTMGISGMKIQREFAMANKNTFKCPPIEGFVNYYLRDSCISVDPFARNYCGAKYNNDLNPKTKSEYHLKALDFLIMLEEKDTEPDLVIFDPPYSMEQCKRSYESYGYKFTYDDTLYVGRWSKEKDVLSRIMPVGSMFLHFGWHTNGMGLKRGFRIEEIKIIAHGGGKYDTLCMAERRISKQRKLF